MKYHWDPETPLYWDMVVLNYDNMTLCQCGTYTNLHSYNVIKWHIFTITYWCSDNMKQLDSETVTTSNGIWIPDPV